MDYTLDSNKVYFYIDEDGCEHSLKGEEIKSYIEDGRVLEVNGARFMLFDEGLCEEYVSISKGNGTCEGDIVAITEETDTFSFDEEENCLTKTVYGDVYKVGFENASITGEGSGFASMGEAIDAAARSATEEANVLDSKDDVENIDINMSFSCEATAYATYMSDRSNVLSVTVTSPLEIGTEFCDEKTVEKSARHQLKGELEKLGENIEILDINTVSSVMYHFSIDYRKYVSNCEPHRKISETVYRAAKIEN